MPTNKHRTTISFSGGTLTVELKKSPPKDKSKLIKQLNSAVSHLVKNLEEEETYSPDFLEEILQKRHGEHFRTPGYYLKTFRFRADLTQKQLAEKLGIKQHHISEMEHNKRPIGKVMAKRLGKLLKYDYRVFL